MSRLVRHPHRWRVAAALLFAAVATGVETTDASAFPVAQVLDDVAEGVAQTVEARVDETVSQTRGNGRHLGFDTNVYPGDRAMLRWKEVEHYDWVGYYLPAPCHKDASWAGRRETLEDMGWGLAVVYVGQQYWGKGGHVAGPVRRAAQTPRARAVSRTTSKRASSRRATSRKSTTKKAPIRKSTTKKRPRRAAFAPALPLPSVEGLTIILAQVRPTALDAPQNHTWDCGTELLTAEQGQKEALDAVERTEAEGFPRGTIVYLDIERMEKIPEGMRDYYKGWTQTVLADGRYVPGYYAHSHNAQQIFEDVTPLFAAAGATDEPRFWIASGRNFEKGKAPTEVGHEFAAIWQGVLDITEVWGGIRLPIDINVSDSPNPSAPATD